MATLNPAHLARARAPRRDRARLPGRPAAAARPRALRARRLVLKAGRPVDEIARDRRCPSGCKHTVRVAPRRRQRLRASRGRAGRARVIGARPRPDRDRVARRGADRRGRLRRRRPGARPRQDRGRRAPPRHRPDRRSASCAASACDRGALASTVAHDAHNIVVVGVERRRHGARGRGGSPSIGGGIVVVEDRGVRAELPLPVAGLLSDAPLDEVVEREPRLRRGGARRSAARCRRRSRRWRSSRCR